MTRPVADEVPVTDDEIPAHKPSECPDEDCHECIAVAMNICTNISAATVPEGECPHCAVGLCWYDPTNRIGHREVRL